MESPNTLSDHNQKKLADAIDALPVNNITCGKCVEDFGRAPFLEFGRAGFLEAQEVDDNTFEADCDIHGTFTTVVIGDTWERTYENDTLTLGEVENIATAELTEQEKDAAKQAAYDEVNGHGRGESHRTVLAKHFWKAIYAHRASLEPDDGMSAAERDSIAEHGAANMAEDRFEAEQDTQAA